MHTANLYLKSIGKVHVGALLTPSESVKLAAQLNGDARDYYYSSVVSLVDGLRSIQAGFFSWATVKLYYSVFYALRARLAISGYCIFYDGIKPLGVSSALGSPVRKLEGTTHKCVMTTFLSQHTSDFFLSQEIASRKPLEWLKERRELVNYKQSRFTEPDASPWMLYASTTGLGQMLESYLSDDVYIHDPDHAIVAFPFRLVVDLRVRFSNLGIQPLMATEIEFLASQVPDGIGTMASLSSLLA